MQVYDVVRVFQQQDPLVEIQTWARVGRGLPTFKNLNSVMVPVGEL